MVFNFAQGNKQKSVVLNMALKDGNENFLPISYIIFPCQERHNISEV